MNSLLSKQERRLKRIARRARRKARREAEAAAAKRLSPAEVKQEKRIDRALAAAIKPTGFVPATAPDLGGYAVFANANRRSAIRVAVEGGVVDYIAMTERALQVDRTSEMAFATDWTRADYDPRRAAEAYAAAARWRGITPEAKLHLERVLGAPLKNVKVTQQDDRQSTTRSTEMKSKRHKSDRRTSLITNEAEGAAAAETPGGGTPHSPTESTAHKARVAAGKSKGKPKAAKKSKPKATKNSKPKATKKTTEPTGKRAELRAKRIKVLASKNPKREGTKAWKKFEVYKTAKTVGEALEKGARVGYKMSTLNYDLKHKYIQLVS